MFRSPWITAALLTLAVALGMGVSAEAQEPAADPPSTAPVQVPAQPPSANAPAPVPMQGAGGVGGVQPVPSGRVAKTVAVITIDGTIDEWMVRSVRRRLAAAQEMQADAVVLEVNSPGGLISASILISTELKQSPIPVTVAWVRPKALSGGAVVALACREMVVTDGAMLGDALPIAFDPITGVQPLGAEEREKLAAPVIADLVDSARRNHLDEMLVQGLVRRGVELWLVENPATGERLFVNEAQYRVAVDPGLGEPSRLSPTIPPGFGEHRLSSPRRGVTPPSSPPASSAPPSATSTPSDAGPPGFGARGPRHTAPSSSQAPASSSSTPAPGASRPASPPPAPVSTGEKTDYIPAEKQASPTLAGDVNTELALKSAPSQRPNLEDAEHRGKYVPVEYVSDGTGLLTLRQAELLHYGMARAVVRDDAELKTYFGAAAVVRLDENWADAGARFLSSFWVKAFLIVVFLVALFVEMTHPGLSLPGGIAAVALVLLVLPPILAGIAGWWALAAIVLGIMLVAVEIFVTPGVAIVGVVGVLLLFGGLVGTFLVGPGGAGSGMWGAARSRGEIGWAVATTFISLLIAGAIIGVLLKFLPRLPLVNRLVLAEADPDQEATPGAYTPEFAPDHPIRPGMTGTAITPLRPAGRVQIGERIVDAVADGAFIDADARVRVVSSSAFRTLVIRDG